MMIPLWPEAPFRHRPYITWALIAVNLNIHLRWTNVDPESIQPWLLDFQALHPGQWLSSAFLHGDWMHVLGNMVFLFVFGQVVEDLTGRWFLPLYLFLAMASGGLTQAILLNRGEVGHALGASAAIYGLVVLALLWAPEIRLNTLLWFGLGKPVMREIRILWLALYFIVWEILTVVFSQAAVSSAFLHFIGILVALPLGLLCLRERWVRTGGLDLLTLWATWGMSPEAAVEYRRAQVDREEGGPVVPVPSPPPSSPAAAPAPAVPALPPEPVPWDDQLRRIAVAVDQGNHRVAWAAYEVVRREHPAKTVPALLLEDLATCCETGLEDHRALQVLDHRLAQGDDDTDRSWLAKARLLGFRLDEPRRAQEALARVRADRLDEVARQEFRRIEERLARRLRTVRLARAPAAGGAG